MLQAHRILQAEFLSISFVVLEPWVVWSVSFPSCSSWFIHMQMQDHPVCQPPPCCQSSPPHLSVSTLPISLSEYFSFNSLVVRLPYSSIFWQFWLFFWFFNWLLFFWLCKDARFVYICLHFGQTSVFTHFKHYCQICPFDGDSKKGFMYSFLNSRRDAGRTV